MILLASSTGMSAPQIVALVRTDESHVRKVIHAFNAQGFGSLDPDYRGGRPKKTTPEQRDRIVAVARTRPTSGRRADRWSIPKLAAQLAGWGSTLCAVALRAAARRRACPQRTRSWIWSPDPDFAEKAERVLALYRATPRRGRGLLWRDGPDRADPSSRPGWARRSGAERLRATYSRPLGTRYLFGAYDVHRDRLLGRLRAHKNGVSGRLVGELRAAMTG